MFQIASGRPATKTRRTLGYTAVLSALIFAASTAQSSAEGSLASADRVRPSMQGLSCDAGARSGMSERECRQYYAGQKINSYCLNVSGGAIGIWQCRQFYAREAGLTHQPHDRGGNEPMSVSAGIGAAKTTTGVSVPLDRHGGTYSVPAVINGTMTLNFLVDSGATDVSIPANVVRMLVRAGTIQPGDFKGRRRYRMADGSIIPAEVFHIHELRVGQARLEDVTASVAPASATLLLGQSFLNRFRSWSLDNERQVLLLN